MAMDGGTAYAANVVKAAAGGGSSSKYSLVMQNDGTIWGWGLNTCGQLDDKSTTDRANPVRTAPLQTATISPFRALSPQEVSTVN